MSYHCKACNAPFRPRKNPHTGEDEVLCSGCLVEARFSAEEVYEQEQDYLDDDILDMLDLGIHNED